MTILFLVLIIILTAVISLFILIQNPKGGGLAGNIAGFNNQFMGVKQTTDVLEKGTWVVAIALALLCLTSSFFISGGTGTSVDAAPVAAPKTAPAPAPATTPNNAVPLQQP
ncbi:MAG TPA: preprotein translocase subunit SecG [Pseudobacter sp.]|jgi:preprotein translocase subunit SecG|nr:preprotein translocase subunit SecG [Pseudobacter sp.]